MEQEYNYTPLSEPIPITEQVWPEGTLPLVSISTLAYNHEPYIRDCLEGFLMQKTTFPVQVLINDDASKDKTADIIKEYEKKYPRIIEPIYQIENQYSKGVAISATFLYPKAKGKYIAKCEGDDYWIDPLKLQKQVDFLEKNPEYGMCHTDYDLHEGFRLHNFKEKKDGIYFPSILIEGIQIATLTVVFRKQTYDSLPKYFEGKNFKMGDSPLWIEISSVSKIKYINDITAKYRILENSTSNSNDVEREILFHKSGIEITKFYMDIYNIDIDINYNKYYIACMKSAYKNNNIKIAKQILYEAIVNNCLSIKLFVFYFGSITIVGKYFTKLLYKILS